MASVYKSSKYGTEECVPSSGNTEILEKNRIRLGGWKAYAVDTAFMNRRENAMSGENLGWRIENMALVELLTRHLPQGHDIYYLNERDAECDFVICRGDSVLECIQVSYDISNGKTLNREIRGLNKTAKITGCRNLTLLTYEDERNDGYMKIKSVYEWAVIP